MGDIDTLTQATARTVLSDSNSPGTPVSSTPGHAQASSLDIADVWQFVLRPNLLRRFTATSFLPTGTVFGVGEGACYRVDKGELNTEAGGELVAIKYLKLTEQPSRSVDDAEAGRAIETVLRELRILTHEPIRECENIVQLLGYGSRSVGEHLSLYLVAEFAAYGTLKYYLGKNKVSVAEKIKFCTGIANGLATLHGCGIVNGDVKLENTLVCSGNEDKVIVKLSDFGHSILDDDSCYIGTAIFNAPEVRLGRSTSTLRLDHYKCDVFSYGLLVWEILQDGRRYVESTNRSDPLTWLGGLPKDDLLRMALLAVQRLLPCDVSKITLLQTVLAATLRDDAPERKSIQEVMKMFDLERAFVGKETKKAVLSPFGISQLSTLERWSLYRADAHASSVPSQLQARVFARLQHMASGQPEMRVLARTLFELAMCYLYGFGVEANKDTMLDLLRQATSLHSTMAMGILHRVQATYLEPVPSSFVCDHPMLQVEDELSKLPSDRYFSARIRRHEKLFQQRVLGASFDLYSGTASIAENLSFLDIERISNILKHSSCDPSCLVVKTSLADIPDLGPFLHMSARLGSLLIVRLLVRAGVNIHTYHATCGTPLTSACRGGNPDVVLYLLSLGATAASEAGNKSMSLHWMIMFEEAQLETLVKSLKANGGDINWFSPALEMRDHSINFVLSPLHFAVQARYHKLVEVLLAHGASLCGGVLTPLDLAVSLGFPEIVSLLLRHGGSSGTKSPLLHQGLTTGLQSLLQHGSLARSEFESTIDLVLQSRKFSDVDVAEEDGLTPLALAIRGCSCEINLVEIEALISRGASVGTVPDTSANRLGNRNDGRGGRIMKLLLDTGKIEATPSLLNQTCLYGDEKILKALIDFGIDINALDSQKHDSISALHSSVLIPGNYPVVKMLLDHGANANILCQDRYPLEVAVMQPIADPDVIDILIERGANVYSPSETTILHVAARLSSKVNGSHLLFHLLRHEQIRRLINVPSRDAQLGTPLFHACLSCDIEAIEALIEAGADVSTAEDLNPISIVRILGRTPDLSTHYKKKDFDLYTHRLRAERTMLMLLDIVDPGHRRTSLHIAALLGNYKRVVQLVESGADVWAGDSDEKTPIGLVHEDAADPDSSQHQEEGSRIFLLESKKILEYLEARMLEVAGAVKAKEETVGFFSRAQDFPDEDDTPELLVVRCRARVERCRQGFGQNDARTLQAMSELSDAYQLFEDKGKESAALDLEVFEKRRNSLEEDDVDLFESRSNHVRILYNEQRLQEARLRGVEYLELAKQQLGDSHPSTEIARWNLSLVDAAEGNYEEALVFQKELHVRLAEKLLSDAHHGVDSDQRVQILVEEAVRNASQENIKFQADPINYQPWQPAAGKEEPKGYLHRDVLMIRFNIAHMHLGLGRRQDADEDINYLVGRLELMSKARYPEYYFSLLNLAQAAERHGCWHNAVEIHEKLIQHASKTRGEASYYTTRARKALVKLYNKLSDTNKSEAIQLQLVAVARRQLGLRDPETLQRTSDLADIHQSQNRFLEENILRQQVADVSEELYGYANERTLQSKEALVRTLDRRELFEKAVVVSRQVVDGYVAALGEADEKTVNAVMGLAVLINKMDSSGEAIVMQEKALRFVESLYGRVHDKVATEHVSLAAMYIRDGRISDGETALKRVLAIYTELHGAESLPAASVMAYLGSVYARGARYREACECHEQALDIRRKLGGSEEYETLYLMSSLAFDYAALERLGDAVVLQKEVLEGYTKLYGEEHKLVCQAAFDLGFSSFTLGDLEPAEKLFVQALSGRRKLLGDSHEDTMTSVDALGNLISHLGRWEEAQPLAQEYFTRSLEKHGLEHPQTTEARKSLVTVYHHVKSWRDVAALQAAVVEHSKRSLGRDHEETIESMDLLSEAYEMLGQQEECEELNAEVYAWRQKNLGPEHARTISALINLTETYVEMEKYAQASQSRSQLLETYRKTTGEDSDESIETKANLANDYVNETRLSEAEVLGLEVVATRLRILGEDSPCTLEAMQCLARIYTTQEKYVQAGETYQRVLRLRQRISTLGALDPEVLRSMKHLEDVYVQTQQWEQAKDFALVILDAMQELAPRNGGKGVLSALSDLRRICHGAGQVEERNLWDEKVSDLSATRWWDQELTEIDGS
ncbi:hypothetical protein QTJ16_003041 [Diplocarpon rosae]|uniref:Protein kinase domain-containing protein n=1 Tax=Diplocarpon rosae TaxID=946125 RepID=A0AAD9WD73_9HELO|nr:hypothetical protein QTJ16_003041 [Diplocarpon rosae]